MLKDVFFSVSRNKCPKCHTGKVFENNNAYNLKIFSKMYTSCPCCGEKFEKEPGYFYGAMYVSYALTVGWCIFTFAINELFTKVDTFYYLIFTCSSIILFSPLTFRLSRLIWLNFFTRFDKSKSNCQ